VLISSKIPFYLSILNVYIVSPRFLMFNYINCCRPCCNWYQSQTTLFYRGE